MLKASKLTINALFKVKSLTLQIQNNTTKLV